MSSIVFCQLHSCSRWFPPSLLCHLAIFCLVVLLISSLSLVATLCSVWSTCCPSFLLYVRPISTFVSVCMLLCQSSLFFLWFLSIVSYLVALDPTFSSPLLFEQFSVCQLFIERPCLAAIGHCWQDTLAHCLVFEWNGELSIMEYFLFFFPQTAPHCSDPGIVFCSVFEVCDLFKIFELSLLKFFSWSISISSLSTWFVMYCVFPLCIFRPTFRLSEFKLFKCFSIWFCFVLSLRRVTLSASLSL